VKNVFSLAGFTEWSCVWYDRWHSWTECQAQFWNTLHVSACAFTDM